MDWALFDPKDEIRMTAGRRLPHWFQPGRLFFITFRTDDSMPADALQMLLRRRDDWLLRQGINPQSANWRARVDLLPARLRKQYHQTFSEDFLAYLDRDHGEGVLKRPEVARIVADALLYFHGNRYHLTDFIVMPNHVHVLVGLLGETDVVKQCSSWKKNSALRINQFLGRRGRFWHAESFDHLVRSEEQFVELRKYVANNPAKASLQDGEFVLWRDDMDPHPNQARCSNPYPAQALCGNDGTRRVPYTSRTRRVRDTF